MEMRRDDLTRPDAHKMRARSQSCPPCATVESRLLATLPGTETHDMESAMLGKISTLTVIAVASLIVGSLDASAGGGRPHQNVYLSGPAACAALQSGTPGYRDCVASEMPANTKTIKAETQMKAEPVASSNAVGILNAGTQVTLLERTANGFWCHIQSGGFSGYVPFEALE
jgi:uncharacterized protein YgiM (DUF1202 family)